MDAEKGSRPIIVGRSEKRCALIKSCVSTTLPGAAPIADYRVSYEHYVASASDGCIAQVPSQVIDDVPANIPRALLPEYITDLILKRFARVGKGSPCANSFAARCPWILT